LDNTLDNQARASLDHHFYARPAEEKAQRELSEQKAMKEAAMQTQAANLYGAGAIGREQSYPEFALQAAAAVTRMLDAFYPTTYYPNEPMQFGSCSRPLTRAEKLIALRAAIVAYEHLPW
jgi:hypothetical protein